LRVYIRKFISAIYKLNFPKTTALEDTVNKTVVFENRKRTFKEHHDKRNAFQDIKASLYRVLIGQFTDDIQDRLKSQSNFLSRSFDDIDLLRVINTVT